MAPYGPPVSIFFFFLDICVPFHFFNESNYEIWRYSEKNANCNPQIYILIMHNQPAFFFQKLMILLDSLWKVFLIETIILN